MFENRSSDSRLEISQFEHFWLLNSLWTRTKLRKISLGHILYVLLLKLHLPLCS